MNLDEFKRLHFPHVEDLKAKGETAWICGVSDGRGKICGRSVSPLNPEPDLELMFADCRKHGLVVCAVPEFLAAMNEHPTAVHFHRPDAHRRNPLGERL